MEIFIDNDNLLTIDHVKDIVTDTYINNAAITVTIKDNRGREVAGVTWPLTVPPVSATTTGKYQVVLDEELKVAENPYTMWIDLAASGDRKANWKIETRALRRTS